ncbi:hypothetical protein CHU93_02485 [Sandarakinorhabdus cyanobacteriorum]|uniref:Uncharacterized protein n=1 Tax=Sandarakinorhabdus cyanobacteriorum TaxID=1981098 RepID=A0A255YXS5_9SPHN|nr:DUF5694 domain-containing protein [Sandarakinorhabdus cyanobacteriorum]OYQ34036.1 hypothetical protein CHU93_02485 [Sandarakinorhabdus cyanobacteriorum]
MVLGTPHLSGTPDGWDPAVLEPLLQRLARFRPDAIAIEALTGPGIHSLFAYREVHPDVARTYGGRALVLAGLTRSTLAMDMPQAEAEVRRTLAAWPAEPSPAQRRRLAAMLVAAGDPNSALVQWWRLDPAERKADAHVSALLARELEGFAGRRNENHLIAARLAQRLGLERVHPTDDQSDDDDPALDKPMEAFMAEPWLKTLLADPAFKALVEAAAHLRTPEEVMSTYRLVNSAAAGRLDADGQWLNMINRPSPQQVGRHRVALWEVRNLRMVANIREVAARHAGGRVLVIVGSAHKPWFEAYLRQMSDVAVEDMAALLAQ